MRNFLDGWTERRVALLVFAVAFVVWIPALWGGFAWDDTNNLVDNTRLRGWAALIEVFKHDAMWSANMKTAVIGTYRPLSLASFVIDYQIFRGGAFGYHLTSLLWHALTCAVVYLALRRFMSRNQSLAVTLLWSIHPVGCEVVAWINGRSEIFALLFGALAIWLTTDMSPVGRQAGGDDGSPVGRQAGGEVQSPVGRQAGGVVQSPVGRQAGGVVGSLSPLRILAAGFCLFLAMMGKETGVIFLPVTIALAAEARRRHSGGRRFFLLWVNPLLFLAALAALGGYLYVRTLVFDGPLPWATMMDVLASAPSIIVRCLTTVVWPFDLAVDYLYLWAKALTPTDILTASCIVGALFLLATWAWFKGHRAAVLMFFWWLLSVVPVFALAVRDWPGLARWLYMGGPGFFAGVALLLGAAGTLGRRAAMVLTAVYGLTFLVQMQRGILIWRNSGSLFEKMVEDHPEEAFGYLSLAAYYLRVKDYPGAEHASRMVMQLENRGRDAKPFLAAAIANQDRCEEAQGLIFGPPPMAERGAWMVYALAACFERAGRIEDAAETYGDCAANDKACDYQAKAMQKKLEAEEPPAVPSDTGTAVPSAPGTAVPSAPGTAAPSAPGTAAPSAPGTAARSSLPVSPAK